MRRVLRGDSSTRSTRDIERDAWSHERARNAPAAEVVCPCRRQHERLEGSESRERLRYMSIEDLQLTASVAKGVRLLVEEHDLPPAKRPYSE